MVITMDVHGWCPYLTSSLVSLPAEQGHQKKSLCVPVSQIQGVSLAISMMADSKKESVTI